MAADFVLPADRPWTKDEEAIIAQIFQQNGAKWRYIAMHFENKSYYDIKNGVEKGMSKLSCDCERGQKIFHGMGYA
jgi:hypothetical protein